MREPALSAGAACGALWSGAVKLRGKWSAAVKRVFSADVLLSACFSWKPRKAVEREGTLALFTRGGH